MQRQQNNQKKAQKQDLLIRNSKYPTVCFKREIFLSPFLKQQLKNINMCQFIILEMQKHPTPVKNQLEQIVQFFNSVSEWYITCLNVSGSDDQYLSFPSILKQVKNIKFHQLKTLNLWKCQIQSIQNLSWISMPQIQQLWLDSNFIVSIKPLIRCHFPQLKQLGIRNNLIPDCNDIHIMHLPHLQIIVLEYWRQDREICKMNNLVKIQSPHLYQIHTQSQANIKQNNVVNQLFKKFSNGQLVIYGGYDI